MSDSVETKPSVTDKLNAMEVIFEAVNEMTGHTDMEETEFIMSLSYIRTLIFMLKTLHNDLNNQMVKMTSTMSKLNTNVS